MLISRLINSLTLKKQYITNTVCLYLSFLGLVLLQCKLEIVQCYVQLVSEFCCLCILQNVCKFTYNRDIINTY